MGSPIHHEKTRRILAKNLRLFLERDGITQNALAQRCEVSQKMLNNVAHARHGVGIDIVTEIAHAFGVEVWVLLYDGGDSLAEDATRVQRVAHGYTRASSADREVIETYVRKVGNSK